MKIFYVVFGIIAIAGVALIAYQFLGNNTSTAGSSASLSSFPSKGPANAPVTVIEYADFQCPGCGAFANYSEANIDKMYVDTGKIHFIYHDFPLSQHPNAVPAAAAARCAADQNQFWEMHKLLFANQAQWVDRSRPQEHFINYATALKLDVPTFTQCVNSEKYVPAIKAAQTDALNAKIDSTPTFVINDQKFTASTLRDGIEAALAKAKK